MGIGSPDSSGLSSVCEHSYKLKERSLRISFYGMSEDVIMSFRAFAWAIPLGLVLWALIILAVKWG